MSATLDFARELVSRRSVTPDDAGCQVLLGERLAALGFELEWLPFGDVTNLWARRGSQAPLFAFAGHTDVVPPGPLEAWTHPPFEAHVRDGYLHGRGAADMKGSLAAMITACEAFIGARPDYAGSIAFLITSDEEGPARDGTAKVVEHLQGRGEQIEWCLIGEPSSEVRLGDMVKNGRRGSLNARLVINGQQGHVAYPERATNPIHRFAPALAALGAMQWDEGSEFFPPTSFQISNLNAGTGAVNVVPGSLEALFNFRYSTALTHDQLITRVESLLREHALDYEIDWNHSGRPFLTAGGPLIDAVRAAIHSSTGIHPELSTVGGTSDGRFIAPAGAQVIELGPVNSTIHKIDECVRVQDLDTLAKIYQRVLEELL